MTTLKEAIDAANASVAQLRPPTFLAALRSFEEKAAKAVKPFESLEPRPLEGVDLDELVRRAKEHGIVHSGESGDGFTSRELRLLAWALWRRVEGWCIAENANLLEQYLRTVTLKKDSHFRALESSYLWHFKPDGPGFSVAAETLRKLLKNAPSGRDEHRRRLDILSHSDPARMVARHFINAKDGEQAMADMARQIGLDGILAQGGMSRAAFGAALREYAAEPKLKSLRRLTAWRKFAAKGEGFCNPDYAEGLLLPWTTKEPPEGIKSATLNALIDSHRDPRLHQVNWAGVADKARIVMFRWLAGKSIEQFFQVIDKIGGGEGAHTWRERQNFWRARHKKGHVSDAWAAFGGKGLDLGESRNVDCAKIHNAPDDAVLLVRIGDLIIADWGWIGECMAWKKGNKRAPQFHQRSYSKEELRQDFDEECPHQENWQSRVNKWIRRWGGARVSR